MSITYKRVHYLLKLITAFLFTLIQCSYMYGHKLQDRRSLLTTADYLPQEDITVCQ